MAGLLESDEILDAYYLELQKEYTFQKHKFNLNPSGVKKPDFFGLRPNNFPTIRLSQFADVYCKNKNLFSNLMITNSLEAYYNIFNATVSDYWRNSPYCRHL